MGDEKESGIARVIEIVFGKQSTALQRRALWVGFVLADAGFFVCAGDGGDLFEKGVLRAWWELVAVGTFVAIFCLKPRSSSE